MPDKGGLASLSLQCYRILTSISVTWVYSLVLLNISHLSDQIFALKIWISELLNIYLGILIFFYFNA